MKKNLSALEYTEATKCKAMYPHKPWTTSLIVLNVVNKLGFGVFDIDSACCLHAAECSAPPTFLLT